MHISVTHALSLCTNKRSPTFIKTHTRHCTHQHTPTCAHRHRDPFKTHQRAPAKQGYLLGSCHRGTCLFSKLTQSLSKKKLSVSVTIYTRTPFPVYFHFQGGAKFGTSRLLVKRTKNQPQPDKADFLKKERKAEVKKVDAKNLGSCDWVLPGRV